MPTIKFEVIINENGSVQVGGPEKALQDTLFMYGLFELAKDEIRKLKDKPNNLIKLPNIQLPKNGM